MVGLTALLALVGIVVLALSMFRGSFADTVAVTVVSSRAGLVMNPDAKVKLNDIQVGTVAAIEHRSDGKAELRLAIDRSQISMIPSNVAVSVASSTVFGAKFVEFTLPGDPAATPIRAGQIIEGDHVTVEINTVFEQLTSVLSQIQPEHLNQTLTALSSGVSGRGAKMGQIISDVDVTLAALEPSLDILSHDIAVAPRVLNIYADVVEDLVTVADRTASIGRIVVEQQHELDTVLLSIIGFGAAGTDVLSTNHRPLAELVGLLAPVTALTRQYDQALYCILAGAVPLAKIPPARVPGAEVMASFQWGMDPYRYPSDLPKVAATGGPQCQGLPRIPYETRPPYVVADTGTNPWKYGNRGITLNTAGMKEFLLGRPLDGPPRNSSQIGMPG
ncbi:MCE family protein [Mycobacterium sp. SMC-4]|uniref:MCE family protein n=1 Tax=Mycobacterium sp. SMC-4 TaxID=2857059 RepID=UPI0021B3D085|nr:MCE family protein [Mycobacterium sp. SMC-4]